MNDVFAPEAPPVGAYGLRVTGVDGARDLLVTAQPDWPRIHVFTTFTATNDESEEVTADRARLRLKTGGQILLDRVAGTARYDVARRLGSEELVHPYLAPTAAVMSHWLGRECFHAGAVMIGGGVWALLGDRLAGKSTLLAALASAGHAIVTDDLLVLGADARTVFEGPRSIDLREDAAEQLALGEDIGRAGARDRWRVRVGDVRLPATLRGWVFLGWDEKLALVERRPAARIELLARSRGVTLPPRNPASLLEAAALPCFELRRPRDWAALPDVVATLVARLTR